MGRRSREEVVENLMGAKGLMMVGSERERLKGSLMAFFSRAVCLAYSFAKSEQAWVFSMESIGISYFDF